MHLVKKLFWINLFNNLFWLSSVITFFYLNKGLNYTQILSLGAITSIAIILTEVPTGRIADKFGRKNSLLLSSLCFIIMIFIYLFANNFLIFALASIFAGIGISFTSGAAEALIYDNLLDNNEEHKMHKQMGFFMSAEVLAGVISPPIASIIAKGLLPWQFNILIYLTLISYFIAFVLTLTVSEKKINEREHETKHNFISELKSISSNKSLLKLTFNKAIFGAAIASYLYLWQPQLQRANFPIEFFGIALAIGSFGIFLVNINIERINHIFRTNNLILLSTILPAVAIMISYIFLTPVLGFLFYLIIRISSSARNPILSKLINNEILSKNRASILSLISMVTAIFSILLQPLIGFISDINFNAGLILIGALCFVSFALFPIKERT